MSGHGAAADAQWPHSSLAAKHGSHRMLASYDHVARTAPVDVYFVGCNYVVDVVAAWLHKLLVYAAG